MKHNKGCSKAPQKPIGGSVRQEQIEKVLDLTPINLWAENGLEDEGLSFQAPTNGGVGSDESPLDEAPWENYE